MPETGALFVFFRRLTNPRRRARICTAKDTFGIVIQGIDSPRTRPPPGGMRSFLKISLSHQKYNLVGNSHNYLFDYNWDLHDRDTLRNDPAYAGKDSGPQS
jgi:hypothetical protein